MSGTTYPPTHPPTSPVPLMHLFATTAPPQPLPPPPTQNWLGIAEGFFWPLAVLAVSGLAGLFYTNSEKRRALEYEALRDDIREIRERSDLAIKHVDDENQETRGQLREVIGKLGIVSDLSAANQVMRQQMDNMGGALRDNQALITGLQKEVIQLRSETKAELSRLETLITSGYTPKEKLVQESMMLQGKIEELGRKLTEGRL